MTSILKHITIPFACSLLLLSATAATAENPANANARRQVPSYLQYQPSPADYPAELKDLVQRLQTSTVAGDGWSALLAEIVARRQSATRGLQDELWFLEGLVLERQNKFDAALKAYNASLGLNSRRAVAIFRKAVCLHSLKRYEASAETSREFLWLSRYNQHEARLILAKNLCAMEQCDSGLREAEAALERMPSFVPALEFIIEQKKQIAATLPDPLKKVELDAAIAADLTRLARIDPNNRQAALGHARYSLAHADPFLHGDRIAEAESIARRYAESSKYSDEEAVRLLFDVAIRRGNTEEASAVLDRGLQVNPQSSTLLEAQRQLGIQQAVAQRRQAEQAEEE